MWTCTTEHKYGWANLARNEWLAFNSRRRSSWRHSHKIFKRTVVRNSRNHWMLHHRTIFYQSTTAKSSQVEQIRKVSLGVIPLQTIFVCSSSNTWVEEVLTGWKLVTVKSVTTPLTFGCWWSNKCNFWNFSPSPFWDMVTLIGFFWEPWKLNFRFWII